MNLHQLVSDLIIDSKDVSVPRFYPELAICGTIVAMLLVRLFNFWRPLDAFLQRVTGTGLTFFLMLIGSVVAFAYAAPWNHVAGERHELFSGMLVYDGLTSVMRGLLLGFAVLFTILTGLTGLPDREDAADIYSLVLGSTLGFCLMASANHLMMVFLAIEMASVPSYALAGMLKGRKLSSEAALKYSVYGAGAAGIMLYGISLVAGLLNTVHLPTLAVALSRALPVMPGEEQMVLALGGLFIAVGLAFKLSAVPFHFWCPDVFEGASAEVNALLSVASKAAALALLVRVAIGFGTVPLETVEQINAESAVFVAMNSGPSSVDSSSGLFSVADQREEAVPDSPVAENVPAERDAGMLGLDRETANQNLAAARDFIGKLIALLAIVTCTFGNLAAYGQTNIKRLLAYSTIAHAGYMMMAVPPAMAMAQTSPAGAEAAVASLVIYIFVYLFMNLGAFAVVAFLRNAMWSEEIADYGGLIRRCPLVVICFSLMLFALVGLPPLSGFIGKFAIFAALADGFSVTSQPYLLILLLAGGINTAISLFYYLRVVKVMAMEPEPESRTPFTLSPFPLVYIVAVTLPTAVLIVLWDDVNELALTAARHLLG